MQIILQALAVLFSQGQQLMDLWKRATSGGVSTEEIQAEIDDIMNWQKATDDAERAELKRALEEHHG